jgi:hypothetical protein
VAAAELSNFVSAGSTPKSAFAAVAEFGVFGDLASVRVESIAVEGMVRVKRRKVERWRCSGDRASCGSGVSGGCIGAGLCKGQEAGPSGLEFRSVFATAIAGGTGAAGVGCRWRTGR